MKVIEADFAKATDAFWTCWRKATTTPVNALRAAIEALPEPAPVPGPMPERDELAAMLASNQDPSVDAMENWRRAADVARMVCAGRLPAEVWGLVDELGRLQREETDAANSLRDSVSLAEFAARAWAFGESKRLLEAALRASGQQAPKVEGPRFQVTEAEWRDAFGSSHAPTHPRLNAVIARRPITEEAEALRSKLQECESNWNDTLELLRQADDRGRDLESQIAQVTRERDEALARRNEAMEQLYGIAAVIDPTCPDVPAALEDGLFDLAASVAKLAARPEPVVIDEALATKALEAVFECCAGVTSWGCWGSKAQANMVSALRRALGDRASVVVPQGERTDEQRAYELLSDECGVLLQECRDGRAERDQLRADLNALRIAADEMLFALGRIADQDESRDHRVRLHDQAEAYVAKLRAELEKTRGELEALRKLIEIQDSDRRGLSVDPQRYGDRVMAGAMTIWWGKEPMRGFGALMSKTARDSTVAATLLKPAPAETSRKELLEGKLIVGHITPAELEELRGCAPANSRGEVACPAAWLCDTQNKLLMQAYNRVAECEGALRLLRAYHRTYLVSLAGGVFHAQAAKHALAYFDEQISSGLGEPEPGTAGARQPASVEAPHPNDLDDVDGDVLQLAEPVQHPPSDRHPTVSVPIIPVDAEAEREVGELLRDAGEKRVPLVPASLAPLTARVERLERTLGLFAQHANLAGCLTDARQDVEALEAREGARHG